MLGSESPKKGPPPGVDAWKWFLQLEPSSQGIDRHDDDSPWELVDSDGDAPKTPAVALTYWQI